MTDFIRDFSPINYEEKEDLIEIVLKFRDDYANIWEGISNNTFSFDELKDFLTFKEHTCYFQRQKKKEGNDNSLHKIIIPIGNNRAIEFGVRLWRDKKDDRDPFSKELCSYSIGVGKEINFFNEPYKETIKKTCRFYIGNLYQKIEIDDEPFKKLYTTIELLDIPTIDINKDKDREIWNKYVEALKRLVKEKEIVWKIDKVSNPYQDKTNNTNERATYIEIGISEKDLTQQFQADIENSFSQEELEDYGVSAKKAFIEFNSYRELSEEEKEDINSIAAEYFYELDKNSPTYSIEGDITFRYTDNDSREFIFSELREKLSSEYDLDININEKGYLEVLEKNIPYVQRIVEDNFNNLFRVVRDNNIKLKVVLEEKKITPEMEGKINSKLRENNLEKAILYKKGQQLAIVVSAPITPDFLSEYGFYQKSKVFIFGTFDKKISLVEIEGIELTNRGYELPNLSPKEIKLIQKRIQEANPSVTIRQLPTWYIFEFLDKQDEDKLREFKLKTDVSQISNFDLRTAILTLTVENETQYKEELQRIVGLFPKVTIEEKVYSPSFFIQFKTELEEQRQEIINKIQNKIREQIGKVAYEPLKHYERVHFSYSFSTEEERDHFKQEIERNCLPYEDILTYTFENQLGTTTYEFVKNETFELENEKDIRKKVQYAEFIYLTEQENQELQKALSEGKEDKFKGGIKIGKLVKKEQNKLRFRISEGFDSLLTAKEEERTSIKELRKGYIKPIFPGELANIKRMINAMKKITNPDNRNGFPVNLNLSNFLFDPKEARESSINIEEEKQRIVNNLNEPLLKNQPKQLEAVAKAIIAQDMALIQGPPGTGKTTVIAEIIWQTLLRNPEAKILITSQTNLAVDNALERLKGKKMVRPIRIGNIEKFEDEGKIYAKERLEEWRNTKNNEQKIEADNAISYWMDNVEENCSKEEKYQETIEKWKKALEDKQTLSKDFADKYFSYINVFAATCSECGSRNFSDTYQAVFPQKNIEFDVVIMDEASKATPPELVLPLTLGKKVIIIGDHKQLPPMIDENEFGEALAKVGAEELITEWTKDDYKISQFEKLFVNAPKSIVASLDTQFRMHEQIMNCITQFYKDQKELENGLICGIKDKMNIEDFSEKASRWHGFENSPFIMPNTHAIWVNVETPEKKIGTSYENEGEVKAIEEVLRVLSKAEGFKEYFNFFKKEEDKEIGIITYYMPQMQRIKNTLYATFDKNKWRNFEQYKYENEFQLPFRINTVDKFQGMERNIVIISTVRSNRQINEKGIEQTNNKYPFALGFAREFQRVNVGFSRAKRLLIVIGNEKHFSHKEEYKQAIEKMHRVDIKQLQNL